MQMDARLRFIIVSTIVLVTVASAGEVLGLTLADGGTTDYVIVVADDAISAEVTAGDELKAYLEQVTGAVFPIHNEAGAPPAASKIYVGPSTTAKSLVPEIDTAELGYDGIVIKTVGQDLVLAGGRTRGTIYAVYTFLQDVVGCGWYEHDAPEVIPNTPTLIIGAQDVIYRPAFDYREPYTNAVYGYGGPQAPPDANVPFQVKLRLNVASVGEEYGGGTDFGGAHTMLDWVLPPDQYFDDHPDWYRDDGTGTRHPDALCFMIPGARVQAAANVIAKLDAEYASMGDPKVISVSHPDSGVHCRDPLCVYALETDPCYVVDSGPLLDFINYIAEEVEAAYPDVLVSTLAYWATTQPPYPGTITARDNVLIHFGINWGTFYPAYPPNNVVLRDYRKPFGETPFADYLIAWNQIASHIYIWDYDTNFRNMIQPHPTYFAFPNSLPFYRDNGVSGVMSQGSWSNAGDFVRMKLWVNAQMLWDPNQDVDALMDEFLGAYYGAAGPYLKQYLDLMDSMTGLLSDTDVGTQSWLSLADLNQATTYFNQAEAAVAGDDELTYRVRRARLSIDIVWLQRYRQLRKDSIEQAMPFLGTDDPYTETDRIALDEFDAGVYYEWGVFSEYIGLLYELFPQRTAPAPYHVQHLEPYQWEEVQQDRLESTPSGGSEVDDVNASNGRALSLPSADLQARWELPTQASGGPATVPTSLAGTYRIYGTIRAVPTGASGTVRLGVNNSGLVNSVGLAVGGGQNYVFFTAEDPGADADTEVFVQVVDQAGTLIGHRQQLTSDVVDQYELDVAYGNGTFHLVYQTQNDPNGSDAGLRVSYMAVTPGGPEAVTIVDDRPDLAGFYSSHGRVAVKSTGQPVVVLGQLSSFYQYLYTENLGPPWSVASEPWTAGGSSSVDIVVDDNDYAHVVTAVTGAHPVYASQEDGWSRSSMGSEVWWEGGGHVQIAVNNAGVHIGWHPRVHLAGGDSWMASYHHSVKSGGSWSSTIELENLSSQNSPRFLASADEVYYFTLTNNDVSHGGPTFQPVLDGLNNDRVDLYQGLTTGIIWRNCGPTYLFPAWNGSQMNLASVEMKSQSSGQSTLVALYLDVLGTVNEVVVYDSSTDPGLTVAGEFLAANSEEYQTLDLGTHELDAGSIISVIPDNDIIQTYIDRLFLAVPGAVPPPTSCEEALLAGYSIPPDFDDDCYVNPVDLSFFVGDWLECIDPCNPNCSRPWE